MAKLRLPRLIKEALDELTAHKIQWQLINNSGKITLYIERIPAAVMPSTADESGSTVNYNIRSQIRHRQKEILAGRGIVSPAKKEPVLKVKRQHKQSINKMNKTLKLMGIKVDDDWQKHIRREIETFDARVEKRGQEAQAKREYWQRIKNKQKRVQKFTMKDALRINLLEKE